MGRLEEMWQNINPSCLCPCGASFWVSQTEKNAKFEWHGPVESCKVIQGKAWCSLDDNLNGQSNSANLMLLSLLLWICLFEIVDEDKTTSTYLESCTWIWSSVPADGSRIRLCNSTYKRFFLNNRFSALSYNYSEGPLSLPSILALAADAAGSEWEQ